MCFLTWNSFLGCAGVFGVFGSFAGLLPESLFSLPPRDFLNLDLFGFLNTEKNYYFKHKMCGEMDFAH